jgi:hypothetical protein
VAQDGVNTMFQDGTQTKFPVPNPITKEQWLKNYAYPWVPQEPNCTYYYVGHYWAPKDKTVETMYDWTLSVDHG